MDLKIAEEVSQLLKKKIILEQDLEKLLSKDHKFEIGIRYDPKHTWTMGSSTNILSISKNEEFNKKVKWLSILEIQKEIEKLEDKIKALKYY